MKKIKLPNVVERGDRLYVRLSYPDGSKRRKEKRLEDVKQLAEVTVALRKEIQEEIDAAGVPQITAQTIGDVLRAFLLSGKTIPLWYQTPLQSVITYQNGGQIAETPFASVPLSQLDSNQGYGLLVAFKKARLAVTKSVTIKTPGISPKGRKIFLRTVVQQPRAIATIHRELEIVRRLCVYAQREGWLARNPFSRGESLLPKSAEPARDRIPTLAEENAMLAQCVGLRAHLRGVLILAAETGLRKKWLLKLRWGFIRFDDSLIDMTALQAKQKRNKKFPRFLGLTQRAKEELMTMRAQWLAEVHANAERGDKIFPFKNFKRAFQSARTLAGISNLRFHDYRHLFATRAIQAGVEKGLAMKMIGHTSEETFNIYLNVDEQIARDVARRLDAARTHHSLTTPVTPTSQAVAMFSQQTPSAPQFSAHSATVGD